MRFKYEGRVFLTHNGDLDGSGVVNALGRGLGGGEDEGGVVSCVLSEARVVDFGFFEEEDLAWVKRC